MKEASPTQISTTSSTRSALSASSYAGSFSMDLSPKTPSMETCQTVRVTVLPGDNSWTGSVQVDVSPESTLGDVKVAVAEITDCPDIKKYGKLIRVKENGDMMVLKETAALGKRTQVLLAAVVDGLEWPPKPTKIKVMDFAYNSVVVPVSTKATFFQIKQVLAEKLEQPGILSLQLGVRDSQHNFVPFQDSDAMGARRMFILEGDALEDTAQKDAKPSVVRDFRGSSPNESELWVFSQRVQTLVRHNDVIVEQTDFF